MHAFDYLSIFVSIIIAFGVTHLLSQFARLIHLRNRVRWSAPALIWAISLLILQVQIWWVSFYRREIEHWTFFGFALYLLIPAVVSTLSYIVLPELHSDVDLDKEFYHNRRWFFALLGGVVVVSLAEDLVRTHMVAVDANTIFRAVFLIVAALGMVLNGRKAQLIVAIGFLSLLVGYIATVFPHL